MKNILLLCFISILISSFSYSESNVLFKSNANSNSKFNSAYPPGTSQAPPVFDDIDDNTIPIANEERDKLKKLLDKADNRNSLNNKKNNNIKFNTKNSKDKTNKLGNLNFYNADIRKVLEVFSKVFKYNIFVDESVSSKKITFFYSKGLTPFKALKYILKTNSLVMKKVESNIIVVFPKQKEREYRDEVKAKTFYLSNADPKDLLQVLKGIDRDTKVYINEKINSITIMDRPEKLKTAALIINEMDKRKPQILVDMKLVDVRREKLRDIGVSYHPASASGLSTIRFKKDYTNANNTELPDFYASTPTGILELLERDSDTKILARPRIRLINKEKAKIRIADVLPIKVTKTSSETGKEYDTAPEWKDVGIKFEVELKNVHLDSNATIQIGTEISSKTGERDGYPIISTQEAESIIRVKDGETVVLGGLVNNTNENGKEDIPFFSKIPFVGNVFKKRKKQHTSREILIFITTKFIYDGDVIGKKMLSNSLLNKAKKLSKGTF